MSPENVMTYRVILVPSQEVAACHLSLREAQAWVHAYNQIMGPRRQALIAEEHMSRAA